MPHTRSVATPYAANQRGNSRCCSLELSPATHRVSANGAILELGPTEFRILHFFMTHAERFIVVPSCWIRLGDHVFVEERTVDVHIRRLRQALEPSGLDVLCRLCVAAVTDFRRAKYIQPAEKQLQD